MVFGVASDEAEAKRGRVAAFALNLVNEKLGLFNCDMEGRCQRRIRGFGRECSEAPREHRAPAEAAGNNCLPRKISCCVGCRAERWGVTRARGFNSPLGTTIEPLGAAWVRPRRLAA